MAQHPKKRKFRVIGSAANPSDLVVNAITSAFSEAQAKLQVERNLCETLGRNKIFWRDLDAFQISPESLACPTKLASDAERQTKPHPRPSTRGPRVQARLF